MKKKYLLLTFLALAIVTSLTAGTLAIYTSTKDLGSTTVAAKKFVFTAAKTAGYDMSVKLAPTESQDYPFTVTNFEGNSSAEIPMYYTVKATVGEVISAMPGMKAELFYGDNPVAVATSTDGNLTYGSAAINNTLLPENTKTSHPYTLRLTWVSDGTGNVPQTTAGANAATRNFEISVTATQNTSATTAGSN